MGKQVLIGRISFTLFLKIFNNFQLLLYAEGTRVTPKKLEASQKFAKEKNLPILKYHLTPRTKGFISSIPYMRGKNMAIYDIQIAFKESDSVKPTMTNLLLGKKIEGHMYMKRIPLEEVPEGDEAAAEWLHKLYQEKVRYFKNQFAYRYYTIIILLGKLKKWLLFVFLLG